MSVSALDRPLADALAKSQAILDDFKARCEAGHYGLLGVRVDQKVYLASQGLNSKDGLTVRHVLADVTDKGVDLMFCDVARNGRGKGKFFPMHQGLPAYSAAEAFIHLALGLNCPYGD